MSSAGRRQLNAEQLERFTGALRPIERFAARYADRTKLGSGDRDDIVQQARIGLWEAAALFEPHKHSAGEAGFLGHARFRARGRMQDWMRTSPLVGGYRAGRTQRAQVFSIGAEPPPGDYGAAMTLRPQNDGDDAVTDWQPVEMRPHSAAQTLCDVATLLAALGDPRQQQLMIEIELEGRYLREVAADLGITESGASRLRARTFAKLKQLAGGAATGAAP